MKSILVVTFPVLLLSACGEGQKGEGNNTETVTVSEGNEISPEVAVTYDGFQLMQASCFSCHSPDPRAENLVAPTLAELKVAYMERFETEAGFIRALVAFLNDPAKNVVMTDAAEKYGIMPQMSLGEEKSEAIAYYLFEQPVAGAEWYPERFEAEQKRVALLSDEMTDLDRGFEYAMGTKSLLGKNLKGKIKSEGTIGALSFCNLKAYHLMDSMSTFYQTEIKRVSDQPRNVANAANDLEKEIINQFKNELASGVEIQPVTREVEEGYVNGYYPIVTNDMCMKCHGVIDQMEPGVYDEIKKLYPTDMATGYEPDQLRGIWVVKMKKAKS